MVIFIIVNTPTNYLLIQTLETKSSFNLMRIIFGPTNLILILIYD